MENKRTAEVVEAVCHDESPRVLATLIRLLGDFDLVEEGLHDAFATAPAPAAVPGSGALPWCPVQERAAGFRVIIGLKGICRFKPACRRPR